MAEPQWRQPTALDLNETRTMEQAVRKTMAQNYIELSRKNTERRKQLRALNKAHRALWTLADALEAKNRLLNFQIKGAGKREHEDGFKLGLSVGIAATLCAGVIAFSIGKLLTL